MALFGAVSSRSQCSSSKLGNVWFCRSLSDELTRDCLMDASVRVITVCQSSPPSTRFGEGNLNRAFSRRRNRADDERPQGQGYLVPADELPTTSRVREDMQGVYLSRLRGR